MLKESVGWWKGFSACLMFGWKFFVLFFVFEKTLQFGWQFYLVFLGWGRARTPAGVGFCCGNQDLTCQARIHQGEWYLPLALFLFPFSDSLTSISLLLRLWLLTHPAYLFQMICCLLWGSFSCHPIIPELWGESCMFMFVWFLLSIYGAECELGSRNTPLRVGFMRQEGRERIWWGYLGWVGFLFHALCLLGHWHFALSSFSLWVAQGSGGAWEECFQRMGGLRVGNRSWQTCF